MIAVAELERLAAEVGLDAVGATSLDAYRSTERAIAERKARGLFADMSFTMARPERSCRPETLLEGAQTLVSGALAYYQEAPAPQSGQAALPRYTWNDAYTVLRARLEELGKLLGGRYRVVVDENDHVDREAAARAGVGFYGKNTMLITPEHGSWVVLGALATEAQIAVGEPLQLDCGECTLCIDACPSDALETAGELDAERCLSYWTQSRRPIPTELRSELAGQAYGCDICQDVCPWNRPAEKRARAKGLAEGSEPTIDLRTWLDAPAEELHERYSRLYYPRNDVKFLRRNAIVAAGAARETSLRPLLEKFAHGDDEHLAVHARWALEQLRSA